MPTLTIVVPCYNEEEVLPTSVARFCDILARMAKAGLVNEMSHLLLVDDGSRDETWNLIEGFASKYPNVRGLKLTRNRGHQNAVLAGMLECVGDLVVSIDADLQDDINAIEKMVEAHLNSGAEIVYGVRSARDSDTVFKRVTAEGFYQVLRILGVESVFNHADFRLLSRRALESFREYEEVNLFLRGMMPMLGYNTAIVEYPRSKRVAGVSKYPLGKMLSLAWEGVTSLSIRPLRLITTLGVLVAALAFTGGLIAVALWAGGSTVSGWTSLMAAIFFLGGVQLLAIGILGEYVGKVYLETKHRPRYLIDKRIP